MKGLQLGVFAILVLLFGCNMGTSDLPASRKKYNTSDFVGVWTLGSGPAGRDAYLLLYGDGHGVHVYVDGATWKSDAVERWKFISSNESGEQVVHLSSYRSVHSTTVYTYLFHEFELRVVKFDRLRPGLQVPDPDVEAVYTKLHRDELPRPLIQWLRRENVRVPAADGEKVTR